ncbi:MAG: TetR family transcriptional regulator, partial [Ilumatobacteraceae bacterium]
MTPQRLTRTEAQHNTRRTLLHAAGRLFVRDGFVATSLADIADEAGVTKGAVYSNFASKEDLFLALLREPLVSSETYAPSKVDHLTGDLTERGRQFGRYAASVRPAIEHVALFLEANAVALRSDRARAEVAGTTRAFVKSFGADLAAALDLPETDPKLLGLISQSLFAGLMMHG